MSTDQFDIPTHGDAGVAFLGVEMGDAAIVIASVFLGLAVGISIGPIGYLGVPTAGFFLNKLYVDWRKNNLPGQGRLMLFAAGLAGYSHAFKSADIVFVGDANVINPCDAGQAPL